jgi:hypothetical protein
MLLFVNGAGCQPAVLLAFALCCLLLRPRTPATLPHLYCHGAFSGRDLMNSASRDSWYAPS